MRLNVMKLASSSRRLACALAAAALAAVAKTGGSALTTTFAVFHVSEYASPGQEILVPGSGFDSTTTFTVTPYDSGGTLLTGSATAATIKSLSDFGAIVTVPSGFSFAE